MSVTGTVTVQYEIQDGVLICQKMFYSKLVGDTSKVALNKIISKHKGIHKTPTKVLKRLEKKSKKIGKLEQRIKYLQGVINRDAKYEPTFNSFNAEEVLASTDDETSLSEIYEDEINSQTFVIDYEDK